MSYTDDIRRKLREMHEKSAHEDIHRLIDANALIDDIDGDLTDGIAERKAIEKIENAPTVEAIPIEWIREYIKKRPFALAYGMMEAWALEKEE